METVPDENAAQIRVPETTIKTVMPEQKRTQAFETEPEYRQVFLKIAEDFLTEERTTEELIQLEDNDLGQEIQKRFQQSIVRHFERSGLADKIDALRLAHHIDPKGVPLDEKALHLIACASEGTHGWIDMLPSLRNQYASAGMNCTMGSAMLHLALEKLGYSGVHTVLRKGHHVVIQELPDGGIKLYDPTSLSTVENQLVGYVRTFADEHVTHKQDVNEKSNAQGFAFTLNSDRQDKIGGFHDEADKTGSYQQSFYAYDPDIKMDVAIALGNLSEIQDDAVQAEQGGEHVSFDLDAYRAVLIDFIRANNDTDLSDEAVTEIAQQNKQTIEELLQVAEKAFHGDSSPPNPFDFLESTLLHPKRSLSAIPNPKDYVGSSERYDQAAELCTKYPELKKLHFSETLKRFDLFDAHDFL